MRIFTLIFVMVFSQLALADYTFNHARFSLNSATIEAVPEDVDGIGITIELMYELQESIFLGASVQPIIYDYEAFNEDFIDSTMKFFAGGYTEVDSLGYLFGYLGFASNRWEAENSNIEGDDTGLAAGAGAIASLSDEFDLILRLDVDKLYDETNDYISLGGSYDVDDSISLEASYTSGEDFDMLSVGGRLNY